MYGSKLLTVQRARIAPPSTLPRVLLALALSLPAANRALGGWGDQTYWKSNAGNANWNDLNWYDATQGWDNHNPNYEGGRNLIFDNANNKTMVNDFSGSGTGR